MSLKCGIVGLPNVGKSTIFNAITNAGAEAANYPFCTIEPNVGMVSVPDGRLNELVSVYHPKSIVPAVTEFVDIAGLVKGASKGEGLGNQFLTHIRECNAIMEVVRCFDDEDITHVLGSVDPVRDIDIIETELILKDLESVEKRLANENKTARTGNAKAKENAEACSILKKGLEEGKSAREFVGKNGDALDAIVQDLALLTAKPLFYCANIREDEIGTENQYVKSLKEFAAKQGTSVVVISGKIEEELSKMEAADKEEFLKELGMKESGLDSVVREGYRILGAKHSLPPAKRNAARGLLKREPKLHNAPASSTPILKRDSSAPRPSPLKISGSTVPGMPPRKPASSGRKARTMSLKTATLCSTCSTCKTNDLSSIREIQENHRRPK